MLNDEDWLLPELDNVGEFFSCVDENDPAFKSFADRVLGQRPSSKIRLTFPNYFGANLVIGKKEFLVDGCLEMGDGYLIQAIGNVRVLEIEKSRMAQKRPGRTREI